MGAGGWVREYAVQVETIAADVGLQTLFQTADATAITFGPSKIGVAGDGTARGKFKLLLTNKPDLVTSSAVKESEKATGFADNTEEDFVALVAEPSKFAPEMEANAYTVSLFMQLLAQTGATQSGITVLTSTFVPYTKIDMTYFAAFMGKVQQLGGVVTECSLMRGCVPSSVKLSAAEGETLKLTAEVMGASWSKDFNGTGIPASADAISKKAFLKWQNAIILMDDAYNTADNPDSGLKTLTDSTTTTRFALQGFELTLTNGLIAKFYNSETIQAYVLGKYKGAGTFVIPWVVPGPGLETRYYWSHIQNFRSGITKHLKIYWGNADATSDNSLVIDMYIKYNTGTLEGDDVLGSNMAFSCVQPTAGTPSVTIKCGHTKTDLNRGLV